MTDGHPTDGHPTGERLSALLDGVAGFVDAGTDADGRRKEDGRRDEDDGAKVEEHLAGCAECRARMAALRGARDLMRTPVPPVAPDVRAASIAAILRESEAAPVRAGGGAGSGGGVGAGRAGGPTPIRARRRPQVLVGSAAAVLILAAAIGVPLALSGRSTSGGSTASTAAEASRGAASGGAASGGAASGAHSGGDSLGTKDLSKFANAPITDLGPVDSVEALGARAASLGQPNSTATPNAAAVPGAAAAAPTEPGPSAGGTFAPLTTLPTISAFESCLSSAVRSAGPGRVVQDLATAQFEGKPALVYVFGTSSGGSSTGTSARPLAVATARTGCGVLGTSST